MSVVLAFAAAAALSASSVDTTRLPSHDTIVVSAAAVRVPIDTPRARVRAIEVSDWYARRLTIHRVGAIAIIPLFALQSVAGAKLYAHPIDSPWWVLPTHRATAAAIGTVFLVNTVTGVWNLWDSRDVADHRALRTVHAISMLTADAGFTYAGAFLSRPARNDLNKRALHRDIAISSMSLSLVSAVAMKILNR